MMRKNDWNISLPFAFLQILFYKLVIHQQSSAADKENTEQLIQYGGPSQNRTGDSALRRQRYATYL